MSEEHPDNPMDPPPLKPPRGGHSPAEATVPQPEEDHREGLDAAEREALVPDLLSRRFAGDGRSYWQIVWGDFRKNRIANAAMWLMLTMGAMAVVAPLLANHRPYLLNVPEPLFAEASGVIDAGAVEPGWQFPLFRALDAADWVLMLGSLLLLTTVLIARRAASVNRPAGRGALIVLGVLGCGPLALALMFSPAMRGLYASEGSILDLSPLEQSDREWMAWLGVVIIVAMIAVGLGTFLYQVHALYRRKADAMGGVNTAGRLAAAFLGAAVLLMGSAWIGSRGQRQQDVTDYHALAEMEGVTAVFAPIRHDYLASESYLRSQAPLGPYLRVQPSGGSMAAVDLGLTDTRRETNLAAENSAAASADNPVPLTRDTSLAQLRRGLGVRRHDSPQVDFTIISQSVDRFPITLYGDETVGDALESINERTDGAVVASLNEAGTRIILDDRTDPRPTHLLGTTSSGSDVASRLIRATRVALSIGFVSTSIALMIGITMGALMGYFGGWVDIVGMRIIEIFMAIPRLFLLLTIIAFIPPAWNDYMLYAMMVVIGATSWMGAARFIRAEFFRLRHQDFVQAAQACGLPLRSILFRHMLPNGVTPVLVDASFSIAAAILLETGLSFLGFGIKPPNPSWGKMLAEAVDPSTGVFYWWMAIFPGLMIFLTVFAFNLIGDALRDAIDPKLKKAAH